MCQDDEENKLVDEAALRLAELLIHALEERRISNVVIKKDNEKNQKSR